MPLARPPPAITSSNAPSSAVTTSTSAPSTRSAEDQQLLNQLNASVDRVISHVSDEPYVLTIPQDEPKFHHYSRYAADAWLINTPFDPSENYQVQYQTFIYRDPYSDVFERVRSSLFDRNFKPALTANSAPSRSATSTPSVGPKKKISLAAYKNKQAQGATSTPADASVSAEVARGKEKEPAKALKPARHSPRTEEAPVIHDSKHPTEEARAQNELKRKHASTDHNTSRSDATTTSRVHSPKKPRLSPSSNHKASLPGPQHPPRQSIEARKRPPSIPVERLSPIGALYLPGRLSPTLPSKIEEALERSTSTSSSGSSNSNNNNSNNSNAQPHIAVPRPGSKHDSVLSHANDGAHEAAHSASAKDTKRHDPDNTTPSLILKLKIPKKLGANLRRLLQFEPRPAKDRKPEQPRPASPDESHTRPSADKDEKAKGVARKISASSKAPEKPSPRATSPEPVSSNKRPRASDDDPVQHQAKRKKPPPPLNIEKEKNPTTPLQSEFRSPAVPHSAIRSQQATPTSRKDRTSVAMKRVESTDSVSIVTPTNVNSRPGAATQPTLRAGTNPKPSPLSSTAKTPESQAWVAEYTRLGNMAKELKHTVPPQQTSLVPESSAKNRKAAEAATLAHIESILAFILSFYCYDRSILCRSPKDVPDPANWVSCHGWYNLVLKRCQPYPRLSGLMAFLGVAYNGVIMRRYTNGIKPDAAKLHEAVSGALRAADQAASKLPLSVLKSEYPQTWKRGRLAGAAAAAAGEDNATKPGRYEGSFCLAVGINTDPLEAVRLCHSLLAEWCAAKGSDYRMKLKLSP